ncbi:hypothetical protein ACIRRA_44140 [Nocardia sp. NPDC101769]|uniref:hypothetical protein n=1 Tax=Nocardia sp. NPDC101769 TaxID=3364333 RepID=UPI0037F2E561
MRFRWLLLSTLLAAATLSFLVSLYLATDGPEQGCDTGTAYIPPCDFWGRLVWWAPGVVLWGTPVLWVLLGFTVAIVRDQLSRCASKVKS